MNDIRKKFGTKLKTLRKQAGLTQENLVEATGLSIDFISFIERGVYAPSFDNLEKLSKALKHDSPRT